MQRSPAKAQQTYKETLESAEDTYDGDEPSARASGAPKRDRPPPTKGGVDTNSSKAHLLDLARRLEVRGRSKMTKDQLVDAIDGANGRATSRAR